MRKLFFYRHLPSDYNRHALILDVLKEETNVDNMLIFGDSRSMFGIDAGIIKDSINFSGEIYNLSSLGQELYESSYFYGLIKETQKLLSNAHLRDFFQKTKSISYRKCVLFLCF